jgi:hypothetical protein
MKFLDSFPDYLKISKESAEISPEQAIKLRNRSKEIINQFLIDKTLYQKVEELLTKHTLTFNEYEKKIWSAARKMRNKIIHGDKVEQPNQETLNLLSKIIYFILKKEIFHN